MNFNEMVHFRMFQMPCCGQALCWVNPRLPNYCPECGSRCYAELKFNPPVIDAPSAWLKYKESKT